MKKTLLSSATIALLLLSGCSSKEPAIDATSENASTQDTSSTFDNSAETISTDNSVVTDENTDSTETSSNSNGSGDLSMSEIENKMQDVNFAFDKFDLDSTMQSKVQNNASLANGAAADYVVKLEGNCDEWGSDEYNFALGLKRAKAVKNEMIASGVDAKRITMVSYGESNPKCNEKTQDCWAQNRRVEVKLLP